ncbi:hypothetical protein KY289_021602 [Solanum tuberosum]|nr:hypothetical protein KY289_021602 [Solanum tuberosum]
MSHQLIEISQNLVKVRWSVKILVIGWPEKLYLARFALMSKQRWSFLMAGCYMRKMRSSFMSKTVGSKLPLLLYSSRLSCPSMQDSWLSPAVALFFKVILSQHARWLAVTSCCFIPQVHFIFVTEVVLVDDYVGRTAE